MTEDEPKPGTKFDIEVGNRFIDLAEKNGDELVVVEVGAQQVIGEVGSVQLVEQTFVLKPTKPAESKV